MLQVNSIHRSFKEGESLLHVLQDISFTVKAGEKVALMGSSGSGKTTLLQIIGALDQPTSGDIIIDGLTVNKLKGKELARFRNQTIGYIFQFHHLLSDFTALENVFIPGLIAKGDRTKLEQRAKNLLKDVGLQERLMHHPGELSGGERQRVALARALFNKPALLLADEPTGNLDHANTEHFLDIVNTLNRESGQTCLIATHDEEVAKAMDYRLVLEDGILVKKSNSIS